MAAGQEHDIIGVERKGIRRPGHRACEFLRLRHVFVGVNGFLSGAEKLLGDSLEHLTIAGWDGTVFGGEVHGKSGVGECGVWNCRF